MVPERLEDVRGEMISVPAEPRDLSPLWLLVAGMVGWITWLANFVR